MNIDAMLRSFYDAVEQRNGAALKARPEMQRHLAR
jgi:hypothetical protein